MTRIGSLFSGYGGLEQGVQSVLGGTVAWHSEIDPGACKILAHRYPDVPNLGDITAIDWAAVEPVDVLTGGFPCQDVSAAGKRLGIRPGTRSGLWAQFAYAIDQLRPPLVVIENVRGLLSAAAEHPAHGDLEPCPWCVGDDEPVTLRALGAVLGELADLGYDASWQGLRAADVGAPHGRFRVFITAWDASNQLLERGGSVRGVGARDAGTPGGAGRPAPADANRAASGQWRIAAPGQAEGRGARSDAGGRGGAHVADAHGQGRQGAQPAAGRHLSDWRTPPHPESHGRHEGRPEPARLVGGPDAAISGGDAAPDPDRDGLEGIGGLVAVGRDADGRGGADGDGHAAQQTAVADAASDAGRVGNRDDLPAVEWGHYAAAIHRWERVLGRPAPAPTELSAKGSQRLSPRFVEFLMGLPAGWVTDVPGLSRNEQLKALGNGVVPQQAAAALRLLLPDVIGVAA